MTARKPHFLLFCDAKSKASHTASSPAALRSQWRCIVDDLSDNQRIEISDSELDSTPERSALIAVVRGLEALQQPSQVTLVTSSPYVNKGLRYGLREWRENDYHWEHFGTEKPVRNADLWRRIDQALQFHSIDCRLIENATSIEDESSTAEITSFTANNQHFRFDDAHPEFQRKAASLPPVKAKRQRRGKHVLLQLIRSARTVLVTTLSIPEYTVYAMESIVDSALSLPHKLACSLFAAMTIAKQTTSRPTTY
jgi:ribonuclease HI